jgi:hypothetical protein
MKLLLEYFGLLVFAFVVLVGGLVALPRVTSLPVTTPDELLGLGLAFIVIAGGFSWYYLAGTHQGTGSPPEAGPPQEEATEQALPRRG